MPGRKVLGSHPQLFFPHMRILMHKQGPVQVLLHVRHYGDYAAVISGTSAYLVETCVDNVEKCGTGCTAEASRDYRHWRLKASTATATLAQIWCSENCAESVADMGD